jgi:hypothetical protein
MLAYEPIYGRPIADEGLERHSAVETEAVGQHDKRNDHDHWCETPDRAAWLPRFRVGCVKVVGGRAHNRRLLAASMADRSGGAKP